VYVVFEESLSLSDEWVVVVDCTAYLISHANANANHTHTHTHNTV
jgi:hypothetical protein